MMLSNTASTALAASVLVKPVDALTAEIKITLSSSTSLPFSASRCCCRECDSRDRNPAPSTAGIASGTHGGEVLAPPCTPASARRICPGNLHGIIAEGYTAQNQPFCVPARHDRRNVADRRHRLVSGNPQRVLGARYPALKRGDRAAGIMGPTMIPDRTDANRSRMCRDGPGRPCSPCRLCTGEGEVFGHVAIIGSQP